MKQDEVELRCAMVLRGGSRVTLPRRLIESLQGRAGDLIIFGQWSGAAVTVRCVDGEALLGVLATWNGHQLLYPDKVAEALAPLGLDIAEHEDGLTLEGRVLKRAKGEWGEPGIWPGDVVGRIWELVVGRELYSHFSGMRTSYQDMLGQLARKLRRDVNE